jgi:hypothetical protein
MSKNNKKTMNERTHNSFGLYKNNLNSNSNRNNPDVNLTEEFASEFDSIAKKQNKKPQPNHNEK